MGAIIDIYKLIRDLIDEAEKNNNLEMVSSLIDIKKQVSDLDDENKNLRKQLELNDSIVRHNDGTYITLKDDELNIHYCAVCWGRDKKLIPMQKRGCIECDIRWQMAMHH